MTRLIEARAFVAELRRDMPLAAFMGVEALAWDGHQLTLQAPLSPNINDKGTAFAGSLASLSTVTGWALLMLWAREHIGPCHVAVYHGELRYRHPVSSTFAATANLPSAEVLNRLRQRLHSHGRGRVDLTISLAGDSGQPAVMQTAGYAVWHVDNAC